MFKIALLVWMLGGTTLAGIAIMAVLTCRRLPSHDMQYIPIAAVAGFVIAVPVAYFVAKRISALTARS